MKFKITLLLFFITSYSFAQNSTTIKGIVVDSLKNSPLELATIAIVNIKDSSLVSYTTSDKKGVFSFKNISSDKLLKVVVSYVGYENFRSTFSFNKQQVYDLKYIYLQPVKTMLNTVTISSERAAVLIKKDTIEFSPEAFKTRPNAVVEELFKKLPGVQVDFDGKISVNGKTVSKILIDGKKFFANDVTLASKNLYVETIDKVQILDDREDDPDKLKDISSLNKIINLKLKKKVKNSVAAKFYSGIGSSERFEMGGLLNFFRDTLQVSVISFSNNLNRSAFSNGDLNSMGGFQRSSLATDNIELGGNTYGIQQIKSAGINFNYDWGNKTKFNLMYFYSNVKNNYGGEHLQNQFVQSVTLSEVSNFKQTVTENKHNIKSLLEWKPDSLSNFRFNPSINFTDNNSYLNIKGASFQGLNEKINDNVTNNLTTLNQFQYIHNTYYTHKFRNETASYTFTNNVQLNPIKNDNSNLSYSFFYLNNSTVDNSQLISSNYINNSVSQDAYFKQLFMKNVKGEITLSGSYVGSGQDIFTYKIDTLTGKYSNIQRDQSNNLFRNLWTYKLRTGFTWDLTNTSQIVGALTSQFQDVSNNFSKIPQSLRQNYFNLLPSLRYSTKNFSISYDRNITQPEISDLQPVSIQAEALYIYTGNPDLKPTTNHNFNIYYNKVITQSQINFSINSSATFFNNALIYSRVINPNNGIKYTSPINVDGNYTLRSSANVGKRFRKIGETNVRVFGDITTSLRKNIFLLNNSMDNQMLYNMGLTAGFALNTKYISFEPRYVHNLNINKYQIDTNRNITYFQNEVNTLLTINLPKNIMLEANYNYLYNSLISGSFRTDSNLLNTSISYQMLKGNKAQIKLSGFDLLNQNQGIYSYVNENRNRSGTSMVLKRYFMLSYLYNIYKSKG